MEKIHGTEDFLCAVGWNGIIGKKKSNDSWEPVTSPVDSDFLCAYCKKPDEIYIGDRDYHFWLWDGHEDWTSLNDRYPKIQSLRVSDIIEYQGQMYLPAAMEAYTKWMATNGLPMIFS